MTVSTEKMYEVPVWFNINGTSQEDAWNKISRLMADLEKLDQLPDYIVEQPCIFPHDE